MKEISVKLKGNGKGKFTVSTSSNFTEIMGYIDVCVNNEVSTFKGTIEAVIGVKPLFFKYEGLGSVDFIDFTLG